MTRDELVAEILTKDSAFVYKKKKHTLAFLTSHLKSLSPKTGNHRMKDGYRGPIGEFKTPAASSKRYAILVAMREGVTKEDLIKLTNWAPQTVGSCLHTDVRKLGWGYDVKGGVITLTEPKAAVKAL